MLSMFLFTFCDETVTGSTHTTNAVPVYSSLTVQRRNWRCSIQSVQTLSTSAWQRYLLHVPSGRQYSKWTAPSLDANRSR